MRRGFVSTSFFLCRHAFSPPFPLDPRHEEIGDTALPPGWNLDPARHFPPLREAVAQQQAQACCALNTGSAYRRLFPVVRRARRCEPRSDELLAMGADRLHSLLGDVLPIRFREMEATPQGCGTPRNPCQHGARQARADTCRRRRQARPQHLARRPDGRVLVRGGRCFQCCQ